MKEIMIRELRDFLFHKPDKEWKMNEIYKFTRTSTYKPDHFERYSDIVLYKLHIVQCWTWGRSMG